jgi:hypothetical protein
MISTQVNISMNKFFAGLIFVVLATTVKPAAGADERPLFTLDDQVWVLFYDLPSRRFRAIRDAFIGGRMDDARRDLEVSEAFLRVEISRALPVLVPPMTEVADRLLTLRTQIAASETTVGDLDPAFARAHWLLSQHYLSLATDARDNDKHRSAGNYLWATAHHMERTVLWSDARIDDKLLDSLEGMRTMADRLRNSDTPARVYGDKPVDNARRILFELGTYLDRKVWVQPVSM